MIQLEICYTDEDGELAVTTVEAKSIDHVRILDGGKKRGATIDGDEFCNYLLDQTHGLSDPILVYRITDRDIGNELIVARRVPK